MALVLPLLLPAAGLLLVVLYLQFRWRYRHVLAAASKLPCPTALPFVGNTMHFIGSINDISKKIIDFSNIFKGLFCIWVGPVPLFVVTNPADVQIILNSSSTLDKDEVYKFLEPYMGNGLLTAPVRTWKKYRRIISPVLHPSNVEAFIPSFNEVCRCMALNMTGKQVFDPRDELFDVSLDGAIKTLLAIEPLEDRNKRDIQFLLSAVGKMFTLRLFKVWLHIEWLYNFLYRKEVTETLKVMSRCMALTNLVRDNVKTDEEKITKGNDRVPWRTIVDLFLEDKEAETDLSVHDWRYESNTMVVGATDSVVATLAFTLVSLANNPDVQSKVYAEIEDVLGNSDRDLTLSDLNKLVYMNQVLMETMRLHGVFPVIMRRASKDTKLTSFTLPAGSRIMISLHAMGWDKESFPEPEKFLPERFSPELQKSRHHYSFLPFSGGPRNCLGKAYAMFFMKTALVHILRKFKVKSEVRLEELEYELKVVMFSKTPLIMKFEDR